MDSQPTVPGDVADKGLGIRVVVGVTCSLSMLGALLIILTYLVMKDLRTTVRLILVHLSIMDFGSALLHLVGVTVFFDRFFVYKYGNHTYMHPPGSISVTVRNLCRTQAFFSIYFNIGAFLWTSSLAIYLYLRIVHFNMHRSKLVFYCLGILSYVMAPIPLALWLFFSHYIGYTPYGGAGWCGLKIINRFTLQRNIFVTIFGYDLLQYTTLILAGVLFVASHLHIRQEYQKSKRFLPSDKFWGAFHKVDYKLLFIPVVFIVLRLPSCFISLTYIYTNISDNFPNAFETVLVYLEGIGDSSQGLANAILFVFFTTKVRRRMMRPYSWLKNERKSGSCHVPEGSPLLSERICDGESHPERNKKNINGPPSSSSSSSVA